jgi:uncharacterized surface anchored protein
MEEQETEIKEEVNTDVIETTAHQETDTKEETTKQQGNTPLTGESRRLFWLIVVFGISCVTFVLLSKIQRRRKDK